MRYVYLYTRPGSYTIACVRALLSRQNTDVLLFRYSPDPNAVHNNALFDNIPNRIIPNFGSLEKVEMELFAFKPDGLIISGWFDKRFLSIARRAKARGILTIVGSDTQWRGSFRQWASRWVSPFMLHQSASVLWVAGSRQRILARHLRYSGRSLWDGYLCCDWDRFRQDNESFSTFQKRKRAFLFSGRLIEAKGIDILVEAYSRYQNSVESPWELWIAGSGPMENRILGINGIRHLGFLQVEEMARTMSYVSAFILPSRFEPWGVVVQEAAASGLPLLLSEAVGAGDHLLRHGLNGFCFGNEDVYALATAMESLSMMDSRLRYQMGRESYFLSRQFLPKVWAETLENRVQDLTRTHP